jgi:hypothetical protein
MKRILLTAAFVLSVAPGARSASMWDQCSAMPQCVARVTKAVAQIRASHEACLPNNLSDQAAVQAVQNYVMHHPEALNERPSLMVHTAIVRAYPCH